MAVTYNGELLDFGTGFRVHLDPEWAVKVLQAIMKYRQEQRLLEMQKLREEGQTWFAHMLQYGAPDKFELFSENEAVSFLAIGQEQGDFSPVSIVCPGNIVIMGEELDRMLETYIDAQGD